MKLALGTWGIRSADAMVRTIRKAVEMGINHIDTAEMYIGAEEIVGKAVSVFKREEVFITSKVLPRNASYEGTLKSCEASLKRLKTEYIDLYLLHWWDGSYPLEETFRAFDKLLEDGKVRYVGVSNFDKELLSRAVSIYPKIVNDQVKYNLDNFNEVENELLPFARSRNILISGYSPFWQGAKPERSKWKILEELALKYSATPYQIILSFLLRNEGVFIIFKTESEKHLKENVKALEINLTNEDVAEIVKVFGHPFL